MKRILACTAALWLAACGGGGGSEPPAAETHTVPASALASTAALVDWSRAQPASEIGEPLALDQAVPPTSDTEEPRPIS